MHMPEHISQVDHATGRLSHHTKPIVARVIIEKLTLKPACVYGLDGVILNTFHMFVRRQLKVRRERQGRYDVMPYSLTV
jgi:hypothetical protein